MRILRRHLLGTSGRQTNDQAAWETETVAARWAGPADVVISHPAAKNTHGKEWKFPLPNDGKTITALVNFATGDVSIQSII